MKKNLLILFFSVSTFFPVFSQIQGRVTDANNQPVEFANIALYALPDSMLVSGTITDSLGFYRMNNVELGNYRMQISFIGYQTVYADLILTEETEQPIIHNFKMEVDPNVLQELVVEGQRPAMKVEAGKLIYHIPSLLKNKSVTNAYGALKEIPGVLEQNGQLTLIGTSGMTILLNGQKTSMTDEQLITLLKSMPKSQVEDIEIMYSASPKYNVRGAAINVLLKKQKGEDTQAVWQGEVAGEFRQRTQASENGRTNITYRGKRASVDALYSYGNSRTFNKEELTAEHIMNNTMYDIDQVSEGTNKYQVHNTRLAFEYAFDNKDKIDISYTGMFDKSSSNRTATTHISETTTDTKTNSEGPSSMHNIKADYIFHFGLNMGADYTYYDDKSTYVLINTPENSTSETEKIKSISKQTIGKTFMYANQTHQFRNNLQINYGVNYSLAETTNLSEATHNDSTYIEATFDTKQKETIWNVFANASKSFSEKVSAEASLSVEFYTATEESDGKRNTIWDDRAYFPAFNISYTPDDDHILQFSLSSDKTYPSYWSLNPSIYHFSVYGITYGNPHLRPMRKYDLGLTYIFKRKYVIRPYFSYLPDYYTQIPYQSPEKLQQEFMEQNFNFRQQIGLLTVIPFNIGKCISSRFIANGMYWREKDDTFFDLSFDRHTFFGFFQLNNDINISSDPDLKMNISGHYTTPTAIQGLYDLGSTGDFSAGFTWTFAKERMKLILNIEDIFNTNTPTASIDYQNQKSRMDAFRDTRLISLSFIYRFGGFKEKERKEVDTSRFGGL